MLVNCNTRFDSLFAVTLHLHPCHIPQKGEREREELFLFTGECEQRCALYWNTGKVVWLGLSGAVK